MLQTLQFFLHLFLQNIYFKIIKGYPSLFSSLLENKIRTYIIVDYEKRFQPLSLGNRLTVLFIITPLKQILRSYFWCNCCFQTATKYQRPAVLSFTSTTYTATRGTTPIRSASTRTVSCQKMQNLVIPTHMYRSALDPEIASVSRNILKSSLRIDDPQCY